MNAPVESVPVIQADRDAAKSLLGRDDAGPSWWSIDSGNADRDPFVQAFARHRTNQVAELVEALGSAFETLIYVFECSDDEQASRAAKEAADQIGALIASHKGEQP